MFGRGLAQPGPEGIAILVMVALTAAAALIGTLLLVMQFASRNRTDPVNRFLPHYRVSPLLITLSTVMATLAVAQLLARPAVMDLATAAFVRVAP